ncbi:RNA methyltransferase [Denitratisoma sp. agr-D3]
MTDHGLLHLTSRHNPRLKQLRQLASDPALQRKERLTLADGPHLVRACLDHGYPIQTLVVSESGQRHPEVVELLSESDCPERLLIGDALFRELSGVVSPVGILAVIPIVSPSSWQDALVPLQDWGVLDGVQDAGNLGSILRSAAAFGIRHILLGKGCAAVWSPKVLRAAQGAHFALHLHDQVDLAQALPQYGGRTIALVLDGAELHVDTFSSEPAAWVLGNEGRGVSPDIVALCTDRMRIPMASGTESLNVAAAAAICFFTAYSKRR